jgi:hypothetical protein
MDLKTKGRGKAHKHISKEVYQFWMKEQPIHVSQLDCVSHIAGGSPIPHLASLQQHYQHHLYPVEHIIVNKKKKP